MDEAAGLSLDVVAYAAPQEHLAVNAAERERPAMDHIGIDVHKRESQIYILAEGGEVIERRIRTEAERFDAVLGTWPRARIVLEVLDRQRMGRPLPEALGHEVIVADPNFAPMCAIRTRKVKTDRRDARALAEACLLGAYRPAHRLSDPQRQVRGRLVTGALDYQSAANCEIWARRIGLRTQRASPTPRSPWGFGAVPGTSPGSWYRVRQE